MATTIFAVFALLLVIRMPVSFPLAVSAAVALVFSGILVPPIVVQSMYPSVQSFPLLAIPVFTLSGVLLLSCGSPPRVSVSMTVW